MKNIAFDESLFVHDHNGTQEWVVVMIDILTKNIGLEIVHGCTVEILKKLITHHIGYNNTIISLMMGIL